MPPRPKEPRHELIDLRPRRAGIDRHDGRTVRPRCQHERDAGGAVAGRDQDDVARSYAEGGQANAVREVNLPESRSAQGLVTDGEMDERPIRILARQTREPFYDRVHGTESIL